MRQGLSLAAFADAIILARGEAGSIERFRARALAITLVLSASSSILAAPLYTLSGLWLTSLLYLGFALALSAITLAQRLGQSTSTGFYGLLACSTLLFSMSALIESPFDFTAISFTLILPVTGLLIDGWRGGLVAGLVGLAVALTGVLVHQLDWALTVQAPMTVPLFFFRFLTLFLGVCLSVATFEGLRASAMTEAQHAIRAKSLFLATMSHELRTPMNGVIGVTELLLETELSPRQRDDLEIIQRSARSLVDLINNILDLSRVESGHLKVEQVPTDVGSIANDVIDLQRPFADEKHLELTLTVEHPFPPHLVTDPLRVRQVLSNLVANALKFTERGRVQVCLTFDEAAGRLVLEVRDTGIGIDEGAQTSLFQPFHQLDASFTRRFGGSGLGLSLVRQFARALGGEVSVESTPGVGSVFRVQLPAKPEPEGPALPAVQEPPAVEPPPVHLVEAPPDARHALKVLVVDDNAINLRVADAMVQRLGYQVVTASNGLEALEKASEGGYFAILMDCHMPQLDGFEATRRLRELEGDGARVPVIAVTASVFPEQVAACLASGMDTVLGKPVSLKSLRDALDRVRSAGHSSISIERDLTLW